MHRKIDNFDLQHLLELRDILYQSAIRLLDASTWFNEQGRFNDALVMHKKSTNEWLDLFRVNNAIATFWEH